MIIRARIKLSAHSRIELLFSSRIMLFSYTKRARERIIDSESLSRASFLSTLSYLFDAIAFVTIVNCLPRLM